ncbi:MAG: OadG family protein [Candidatus Fermentibacter sp.]|nr:OadG family protein [Candidatus Fermentibacter sp.]
MTAGLILLAAAGQSADPVLGQGVKVSVVGMVIVFAGLVILTLLLPLLSRMIARSEAKKAAGDAVQESTSPLQPTDEEVAAAVSAIHAHFQSLEQIEHVRLTLGMYDKPYRPWRLAGRAEVLLGRQALGGRPRNRSL